MGSSGVLDTGLSPLTLKCGSNANFKHSCQSKPRCCANTWHACDPSRPETLHCPASRQAQEEPTQPARQGAVAAACATGQPRRGAAVSARPAPVPSSQTEPLVCVPVSLPLCKCTGFIAFSLVFDIPKGKTPVSEVGLHFAKSSCWIIEGPEKSKHFRRILKN